MAESAIVKKHSKRRIGDSRACLEADFEIIHYYNNEGGSKEKAVAAGKKASGQNGDKTPERLPNQRHDLPVAICVSIRDCPFLTCREEVGEGRLRRVIGECADPEGTPCRPRGPTSRSANRPSRSATSVLDELEERYRDAEPRVMTVASLAIPNPTRAHPERAGVAEIVI